MDRAALSPQGSAGRGRLNARLAPEFHNAGNGLGLTMQWRRSEGGVNSKASFRFKHLGGIQGECGAPSLPAGWRRAPRSGTGIRYGEVRIAVGACAHVRAAGRARLAHQYGRAAWQPPQRKRNRTHRRARPAAREVGSDPKKCRTRIARAARRRADPAAGQCNRAAPPSAGGTDIMPVCSH